MLGLAVMPDDLGHELGPIQLCQGAVLVAAAACLLYRLRTDGLAHRLAPVWVVAACAASYLAWRELEIDKQLFELHAFSWRYLARNVPLWHKVVFGTLSIGSIAGLAWYLHRHWRRFVSGLRRPWPPLLVTLGVAGVLTLCAAQLWDKSYILESFLSVSAFHSDRMDPLPEEMLELVGQLLLLSAAVELNVLARQGHPALADAAPDASDTRRTAVP